jgi:2-polyprenyl-3-methyl-5-hydroxy-6-metoxy-1,4-benzoquinol methylase
MKITFLLNCVRFYSFENLKMVSELEKLEKQWNEHAEEWNRWIGDEGDANRKDSSDAYLWKYIGNVDEKVILDAGCGNGYLTIKFVLDTRAKQIIGVDLSSALIKIAKENANRRIKCEEDQQRIELHHDSITELKSVKDNSIDLIISNYVLMDTPDLDSVLKVIILFKIKRNHQFINIYSHLNVF